jgi:hypothetical protein
MLIAAVRSAVGYAWRHHPMPLHGICSHDRPGFDGTALDADRRRHGRHCPSTVLLSLGAIARAQ